jgi:hypothetical protein
VVAALFGIVWGLSNWKNAFDILVGSSSPFCSGLGPSGLLLAIAGYLAIPAVIGTVVAIFVAQDAQKRYISEPPSNSTSTPA